VIALVGNKIDLCDTIPNQPAADLQGEHYHFAEHERHQDRKVTTQEASQYAADYPLLFFETSARLNINVDKVFAEIGKEQEKLKIGVLTFFCLCSSICA
jgi:GTPase SAR1 family protein